MTTTLKPAFAYVTPVFALAFMLGALRVSFIAPTIGPLPATALEVPVVLAFSWWIAGRVLARWHLAQRHRAGMAILAFLLLMLAELMTALALGQTVAQFLHAMTTTPGLVGLAGQIGFGLIPLLGPYPRG